MDRAGACRRIEALLEAEPADRWARPLHLRGEVGGAFRAVARRRIVVAGEGHVAEHVRTRLHPDVVGFAWNRIGERIPEGGGARVPGNELTVDVSRARVAVDRLL